MRRRTPPPHRAFPRFCFRPARKAHDVDVRVNNAHSGTGHGWCRTVGAGGRARFRRQDSPQLAGRCPGIARNRTAACQAARNQRDRRRRTDRRPRGGSRRLHPGRHLLAARIDGRRRRQIAGGHGDRGAAVDGVELRYRASRSPAASSPLPTCWRAASSVRHGPNVRTACWRARSVSNAGESAAADLSPTPARSRPAACSFFYRNMP